MHYTPPPHVTQHWQLSKPSAKGRRGMVVSQAKGAAEAGVAVLDAGGNAIDAAVATALALATHEPWNSGLGGIGFALVHRAGQKRAEVVDFGPRAPGATNPATYKLTGRMTTDLFAWPEVEGDINIHGPLSVAIPAAVAGYEYMHRQWGQAAAVRGDRAGHRAGEARAAAGLVHRAEGRHLGARRSGCIRPRRRSICRTDCRRCRRIRASPASSARAICRTRWSASARRGCATSTRARSRPRLPPICRSWAACCRWMTCAIARCARGRRRKSAGAAAHCNSPAG